MGMTRGRRQRGLGEAVREMEVDIGAEGRRLIR